MNKSFYTYTKKDNAIDQLKMINNDYHLISSDKNTGGAKYFHLCSYNTIFNKIKHNKNNHYYENYTDNQPIKFFLDIDCKIDKYPDYDINIIDDVLNVFETLFNEFGYENYPIIILSANTDFKISYHLIFPTIIFKSNQHIKNFLKNIQNEFIKKLIDEHIIDLSVYGNGCFRLFGCSKLGKNNKLITNKLINYEYHDDKQIFMDILLLNFGVDTKIINYVIQNEQQNVKIKK